MVSANNLLFVIEYYFSNYIILIFAFIFILNRFGFKYLATMSSNNVNHEDTSRDGNRPPQHNAQNAAPNNAAQNNEDPPRLADGGGNPQLDQDGNRLANRQLRAAAHIRRLDPFIGARYPAGSNFQSGIQRNAQNHNRVFSRQTASDHRSIIRSWLREIFPRNDTDEPRLRRAFRLVPSLIQYIDWCLRNQNTPNRVTVHSVVADLGFTDPLDNPNSFFHSTEELDRFTTFIYGLILSAYNGLPIQRTHQPVRNSNWLRNLPADHVTRILRTDDVFLIQPCKDPEEPLSSPRRPPTIPSNSQVSISPRAQVTSSHRSHFRAARAPSSDNRDRVTQSASSNSAKAVGTNSAPSSSGGWGTTQVAKSSGGWETSVASKASNPSGAWVTSNDDRNVHPPTNENEESEQEEAVVPVAALPSVAEANVAIETSANDEVTSPDVDPNYVQDVHSAINQSIARAQMKMNQDLDRRFAPRSNRKWCDIAKRHFTYLIQKDLLPSFPAEFQTNETPYFLNTPGC